MLFELRKHPLLNVQAPCRTGCKRTVHKLQLKPKTTDELNAALLTICEVLPQEHINQAVANFMKRLTAYVAVAASGRHFEHLQ